MINKNQHAIFFLRPKEEWKNGTGHKKILDIQQGMVDGKILPAKGGNYRNILELCTILLGEVAACKNMRDTYKEVFV